MIAGNNERNSRDDEGLALVRFEFRSDFSLMSTRDLLDYLGHLGEALDCTRRVFAGYQCVAEHLVVHYQQVARTWDERLGEARRALEMPLREALAGNVRLRAINVAHDGVGVLAATRGSLKKAARGAM